MPAQTYRRRQRPVKGGRHALPSCVLGEILRAVEADAMHYGVSKSFVISCILARVYRIDTQEPIHLHADQTDTAPLPAVPPRLRTPAGPHH